MLVIIIASCNNISDHSNDGYDLKRLDYKK